MRLLNIIYIMLLMFYGYAVYADAINGRVVSAINGSPIIGANVFIDGTSLGSATDNRGEFSIHDIPQGEYVLSVTYVGHRLKEPVNIIVKPGKSTFYILEMEEETYESESIVITGTRTKRLIKDSPVTTEVIHADEIRGLGAENVGEVLEERAGIIITQDGARGGLLSAQLQGLNDDHTLVLIDGAPLIGRIAGKLDLSRISVQNIERIEIIKGAASSLYGSEAVGGVINIITRVPEEQFSYFGNFNLGSYEARNAKLDLSLSKNKTSVLTTAELHSANGYDLDPTTVNTTSDAYKNYSIFSKLKYESKFKLYEGKKKIFMISEADKMTAFRVIQQIHENYAQEKAGTRSYLPPWDPKNLLGQHMTDFFINYQSHNIDQLKENLETLAKDQIIANWLR